MDQADRPTSTTTPESEKRVPRWPADDAHVETEIGRLYPLWRQALEASRIATERYEAIQALCAKEGRSIPPTLLVHEADFDSRLASHSKLAPGGRIRWFDPAELDTFLSLSTASNRAIASRAEEIVSAARKYLDERENTRRELGFYDAMREDQAARAKENLLRIQIVVLPSRTFADIVLKAQIAETLIVDVDEELLSLLSDGEPARDVAFHVSILRDVLAFAR